MNSEGDWAYWREYILTKSTPSNEIFNSIYANVFPIFFPLSLTSKFITQRKFWKSKQIKQNCTVFRKIRAQTIASTSNGSQCDWIEESDEFDPSLNLYLLEHSRWWMSMGGFSPCTIYSSDTIAVCIHFILIFHSRGRRGFYLYHLVLVYWRFVHPQERKKETSTPFREGHWIRI